MAKNVLILTKTCLHGKHELLYGFEVTPNVTPRQDGELARDGHLYRSIVGSIMYAPTCTRPDVAFAVKELS